MTPALDCVLCHLSSGHHLSPEMAPRAPSNSNRLSATRRSVRCRLSRLFCRALTTCPSGVHDRRKRRSSSAGLFLPSSPHPPGVRDAAHSARLPLAAGCGRMATFRSENSAPVKPGAFLSSHQSNGVVDAQSNFGGDLVLSVGCGQRCKCPGNSPWCSGGRCGRRSGGRPSRCRSGRCRGSGYRHGQWNSGSATGSCSGCEHDHRFWRYTCRPNKFHEEVRSRPSRGRFSPGWGRDFLHARTSRWPAYL
jgi:hypothetical protein